MSPEQKREAARLRKQRSRAKAEPTLVLPLPPGLAQKLERICVAGGFEDPRELISNLILNAEAAYDAGDRHEFERMVRVTVTPMNGLDKYLTQLSEPHNLSAVETED